MTEICKEYAFALFDIAKEKACEKQYNDILIHINTLFSEFSEYTKLLSSPDITEKDDIIDTAFSGKIPDDILIFLKLLCKNKRICLFGECVKEYNALYEKSVSVSTARIVSATKLSNEEKAAVVKKLETQTDGTVKAEFEVDKSILGGLIIYMNDTVTDGSIRHKLQKLKEVTKQ